MVKVNSVVLYKNDAAVVTSDAVQGKYAIRFCTVPASATKPAVYGTQNVRAKDFILLHEGPASSLENVLSFAQKNVPVADDMYNLEPAEGTLAAQIKEVYELLVSDGETANAPMTFAELSALIRSPSSADESYGIYAALKGTVFFNQNLAAQLEGSIVFTPRPQAEIDSLVKKADEKGKEAEVRAAFLERLKQHKLELPGDAKFMVDVEALALGKTDKSRTLHDAHIKETPERAHKLLLDTGLWDITRNPYPVRWGLSMQSATEGLASPPEEDRVKVDGVSYAIDNAWSTDPDDAIAFDGTYVWVHIADPASTVLPDSSIDKTARERGATLYIPEGASRMLCEDALSDYALGLNEISRALSFRIKLNDNGDIDDCTVLRTIVDVKRLTYEQADGMKDTPELAPLFKIAQRNLERRNKAGAVNITLPEVHITVDPETKKVSIGPSPHPESADVVREMMLLAGEGAARFAFKNSIPFPFVSQEAPDIPADIPEGLAGQFRLRKCMRRRNVNITPSVHAGLGLGMYSQVTSPLRRYGDLIGHEQLRAFICGRDFLDKDTMLAYMSEGDAAATASHKAERKSNTHWTLVYLLQNPDWTGDAVCVEKQGKQAQFIIPSLGMETIMTPSSPVELNTVIQVKAGAIDIPNLEVNFMQI